MRLLLLPLLLLIACFHVLGQNENQPFQHEVTETIKPWSEKPFYNNPDNFQFVVVSDRTGGHREGVFGKGVERINKLYPEFVMSVGDLIEGYTKDPKLLDEQWSEFDSLLNPLNFRFFYVAGNHDYSNEVMADRWEQRFSRAYYHFVYKDVLFLIINTNDGDGVILSDEQINYLKKALSDNVGVRWTMLFMHHPIWGREGTNFDQVEEALQGRDYTVFAGHTHHYFHDVRNDQNHYVLGTTGGGSRLRGAKFGEFDHVAWVTMTDRGPKMVNLALSGIIDHDVVNRVSMADARGLLEASNFQRLVLTKEGEQDAHVELVLSNTGQSDYAFKARFYHNHHLQPSESRFEQTVAAGESERLRFVISRNSSTAEIEPVELDWSMGYESELLEPDFALNGIEAFSMDPTLERLTLTEQNIFFEEHQVDVDHPFAHLQLRYTLDGTDPGIESPLWDGPITLSKTSEVKLALFDEEGYRSDVFSRRYDKVKPLAGRKRVKGAQPGLSYEYYEGNYQTLPDFSSMNPKKTGVVIDGFPLDDLADRIDHYAFRFQGFLEIPKTGIYTFHLRSDDGSRLFLDGQLVVDNDGSHSARTRKGWVALEKGMHQVVIEYFEDFLGQQLRLQYEGPGLERQVVPFGSFSHISQRSEPVRGR